MLVKKPLIGQLSAPESIKDHTCPKTIEANTPVTGVKYTTEQNLYRGI